MYFRCFKNFCNKRFRLLNNNAHSLNINSYIDCKEFKELDFSKNQVNRVIEITKTKNDLKFNDLNFAFCYLIRNSYYSKSILIKSIETLKKELTEISSSNFKQSNFKSIIPYVHHMELVNDKTIDPKVITMFLHIIKENINIVECSFNKNSLVEILTKVLKVEYKLTQLSTRTSFDKNNFFYKFIEEFILNNYNNNKNPDKRFDLKNLSMFFYNFHYCRYRASDLSLIYLEHILKLHKDNNNLKNSTSNPEIISLIKDGTIFRLVENQTLFEHSQYELLVNIINTNFINYVNEIKKNSTPFFDKENQTLTNSDLTVFYELVNLLYTIICLHLKIPDISNKFDNVLNTYYDSLISKILKVANSLNDSFIKNNPTNEFKLMSSVYRLIYLMQFSNSLDLLNKNDSESKKNSELPKKTSDIKKDYGSIFNELIKKLEKLEIIEFTLKKASLKTKSVFHSKMEFFLNELKVNYKSDVILHSTSVDVFLPEYKTLFMMNGPGHYYRDVEVLYTKDMIRNQILINNGYNVVLLKFSEFKSSKYSDDYFKNTINKVINKV